MAQTRPIETSSQLVGQVIKDDHERILALFHLYLGSPPDSRQAMVEEILHELASHLETGERLFQEIRKLGPQDRKLIEEAELEHEKVKVMTLE